MPFLIWLFLFLLAILVLTWVFFAVALNQAIQSRLEAMSQTRFRRVFVIWLIVAVLLVGGWIIGMSWPPTMENIGALLTSPIGMIPVVIVAAMLAASFVPFWKESKRRQNLIEHGAPKRQELQDQGHGRIRSEA